MIDNPDVKQKIIHCLRVFAKYSLANVCARQFLHLSYLQEKKKSGSGDRPTFRRLIAPISEEVSDMIHAKEIVVVFVTTYTYYHRISYKKRERLVREKLVFNVSPGWVMDLENKSYNSLVNKVSNFNTLKQEMRKWLDKKRIPLSRVSSGRVEPDNISTV